MRFGICMVPFGNPTFDHGWLQPKPTVKSYDALRRLGFSDLRLQFAVGGQSEAPVSPSVGQWDTSLFDAFIRPAVAAGMRVNLNYTIATPTPAHVATPAFHHAAAARIVRAYNGMIDSYSYGNEPGADAQKYELLHGGDYMREVYFPDQFLPFMGGIHELDPYAVLGGCDADSDDIQKRFTDGLANLNKDILCDEELVHPYGEVGGGDYATLAKFDAVLTSRPWGISEIDHQQLPGATGVPRPSDSAAMVAFAAEVVSTHPDCSSIFFSMPDYFFERGAKANGLSCNSFYLPEPVVSAAGHAIADLISSL